MKIIQYLLDYMQNCPDIIKTAWALTAFFAIVVVMTAALLNKIRIQVRKREQITSKYQEEYEQLLITYLFSSPEENETFSTEQKEIVEFFKTVVTDSFKRKILIGSLLKLKNDISGEMADSIDLLYVHIGLIDYTFENLRSRRWHLIAKGIRELTQFNVTKAQQVVLNNINHPRREVRKEMLLYLVQLFRYKGLNFLDTLTMQMSEWDQIQLLEALGRINTHETFEINHWLKSHNDSVILFSLRMAKIFNLFEIKEELLELLHHPNQKIREEAIHLLNHFFILESKDQLLESFHTRTSGEQLAIINMLENFGTDEDEAFLLEAIDHEDLEIRVTCRKLLKDINTNKYDLEQTATIRHINPSVYCSA